MRDRDLRWSVAAFGTLPPSTRCAIQASGAAGRSTCGSRLIILFGLSWIAQRTGASLLIAGFGAGLMVAATGGPKRLSTEVLGVGGGFFIPLFFVVLGASINLRGLVQDPALIGLALAIAAMTVARPPGRRDAHPATARDGPAVERSARRAGGDRRARALSARDHRRAGGGDHRGVDDQPRSLRRGRPHLLGRRRAADRT